MAQSNVKLTVDARGAVAALNNTSVATNKLSASAKGTTASLAGTSAAAKGLAASLAATMGPIIALGAAFSTINSAFSAFSDRERDVNILRQGLENLGEGTASLNKLQKAASRLGDETLFNQEEFTRGFNLLTTFRKIGVDSYERVAKAAADIAQVNQVDVKTSFMQLAKALEDPERNLATLNRSGISFTKTQIEMIKSLMKTNKTAEAHTMILDVVNGAYKKLALAGSAGFAGQVDLLGEAWRDLGETLGKAVIPVLSPAVKGLTTIINFLNSSGGQAAAIIAGITLAVKGLSVALPLLSTNLGLLVARLKMTALSAALSSSGLKGLAAANFLATASVGKLTIALTAFKFALAQTGIGLAVIAIGAFVTAMIKAIDKQKEFNNLLTDGGIADVEEALKSATDKVTELETELNNLSSAGRQKIALVKQLERAKLEVAELKPRLEKLQKIKFWKDFDTSAKSLKDQNETLKDNIERAKLLTDEAKHKFDLDKKINELNEKYGEGVAAVLIEQLKENATLQKSLDLIKEKQTETDELKEKMKDVGDEIKNNIRDNLREAITGAQSFGDAMSNVLKRIRDKILDSQLDKLIEGAGNWFSKKADKGGLFGGIKKIFGFADGGRPSVGRPSVVGERGPELFVPDRAATIIPNHQMGGSTTININIDGTGEGGPPDQRQLGMLISASVRNIIAQEQRPGGTLA